MNNRNAQSIFIRIADRIADRILNGTYLPGERIPSVREMAVETEVNPNTVMRSYERLQNTGVIYNKRGIGYFTSPDACEKIKTDRRADFLQRILPEVFDEMALLDIGMEQVESAYRKYLNLKNNYPHETK